MQSPIFQSSASERDLQSGLTSIELARNRQIAANKRKLEALGIPEIVADCERVKEPAPKKRIVLKVPTVARILPDRRSRAEGIKSRKNIDEILSSWDADIARQNKKGRTQLCQARKPPERNS